MWSDCRQVYKDQVLKYISGSTTTPVERSKEMKRLFPSVAFLLLFMWTEGEAIKFPPESMTSIAGLIPVQSVRRNQGSCGLSPELGCSGTVKLIEDCQTLGSILITILVCCR